MVKPEQMQNTMSNKKIQLIFIRNICPFCLFSDLVECKNYLSEIDIVIEYELKLMPFGGLLYSLGQILKVM